jgi:hypothetical protein
MERTVRAIRRTLAWIEAPGRAQIVDALAPPQPKERAALRDVLALRKHAYSPDGHFSAGQIDSTERFLYSTETEMKQRGFRLGSTVDERRAGRTG